MADAFRLRARPNWPDRPDSRRSRKCRSLRRATRQPSRVAYHRTTGSADLDYVRSLGAEQVLDYKTIRFETEISPVDIVLDMVGGETRSRSLQVIKPGGILVSVVSPIPENEKPSSIRTVFFLVEVTTARLNTLTNLFEIGKLSTQVGAVLPLDQVQTAHQMLAGAPHNRGKIVLSIAPST